MVYGWNGNEPDAIISPIRDTELQVIHDGDIENVYRSPGWRLSHRVDCRHLNSFQPAGGFFKFHTALLLLDLGAHADSMPWWRFATSASGEARKESNAFAAAGRFDAVHTAAENTVST
jgi:hypothetical protein